MTILDFYFREILIFFFQQSINSSPFIFCPDNSCFVLVKNYSNTIFTKWLVSILCNVTAYILQKLQNQSNQTTIKQPTPWLCSASRFEVAPPLKIPFTWCETLLTLGPNMFKDPPWKKKFQNQLFKNSNALTIATWLYLPPGPPRSPIPGTKRLADLKNKILFSFP